MVTENVSVSFKVVNGSEGIVEDIRYTVDDAGRRSADVVYVRIERCAIQVTGLEEGVVPIFPTSISIEHPVTMGATCAVLQTTPDTPGALVLLYRLQEPGSDTRSGHN